MRIALSKFGEVSAEEIGSVIKGMEECYNRLMPHDVTLVDLYIFERSSSTEAFFAKEYREVGVTSAPFDELFFAMHDAWRGTPRIVLCLERMKKLPRPVQLGGIQHEVGHSVLHGNLSYYLLPLPPVLLSLADQFNFPSGYATNLLYLISIAVKDYEVSRLLHERGYVEDQVTYVKHLLTISENDKISWEMARGKPLAEILHLISYLKVAGCATPFLSDKTCEKEITYLLKKSLAYLSTHYGTLLFEMILEGFQSLGTDTLNNVDYMTRLTIEKIVKPVLREESTSEPC